jgi:hypothetical protein
MFESWSVVQYWVGKGIVKTPKGEVWKSMGLVFHNVQPAKHGRQICLEVSRPTPAGHLTVCAGLQPAFLKLRPSAHCLDRELT